jgi:hypothetical protein
MNILEWFFGLIMGLTKICLIGLILLFILDFISELFNNENNG